MWGITKKSGNMQAGGIKWFWVARTPKNWDIEIGPLHLWISQKTASGYISVTWSGYTLFRWWRK